MLGAAAVRRAGRHGLATALVALLLGCGSTKHEPATNVPEAEPALTISFETSVDPGVEDTLCRYSVVPSDGILAASFSHSLRDSSHHLLIFATTLTAADVDTDQIITNCESNESVHESATSVLLGAQPGDAVLEFPPGVALDLPGGAVVLAEYHVLNSTSERVATGARLDLFQLDAPLEARAGILHFYNWAISVPPRSAATAKMRCRAPEPMTLILGNGHFHDRGRRFRAWMLRGEERTLFYEGLTREMPTETFAEAHLDAGDAIEFECEYDNPTSDHHWQGISGFSDEMCSFSAAYVAESGERMARGAEECTGPGSGVVGQGRLDCDGLDACFLDAWEPMRDVTAFGLDAQRCWLEGCPEASTAFNELMRCRVIHCTAQCQPELQTVGAVAYARATPECATCVARECGQVAGCACTAP